MSTPQMDAFGIDAAFLDVKEFHVAFGCPAPAYPQAQPLDAAAKRADWIEEETGELRDARTLVDQADAYVDILYFAIGGLVEIGVPPARLWAIVHAANMAKLWPDGRPRHREDGKIVKPPGWQAPEPKLRDAVTDMRVEAVEGRPIRERIVDGLGLKVARAVLHAEERGISWAEVQQAAVRHIAEAP